MWQDPRPKPLTPHTGWFWRMHLGIGMGTVSPRLDGVWDLLVSFWGRFWHPKMRSFYSLEEELRPPPPLFVKIDGEIEIS